MRVQELNVVLDGDGRNILVKGCGRNLPDIRSLNYPAQGCTERRGSPCAVLPDKAAEAAGHSHVCTDAGKMGQKVT